MKDFNLIWFFLFIIFTSLEQCNGFCWSNCDTLATNSPEPTKVLDQSSDTPSIGPTLKPTTPQIEINEASNVVNINSTNSQDVASSEVPPEQVNYNVSPIAILPKISAFLSLMGSTMILISVLRSKKNRQSMQQRIVCAMSFFDFLVSIAWVATGLFVPSSFKEKGFPLAIGNEASCNAQGFIIQLYTASFIYNVSLSLYYTLIIRRNWPMHKMKKLEKCLHIVPVSFGLITAILAVSLNLIGDANWDCWIEPQYAAYQWGFFFGPLMLSLGTTCFLLMRVYLHVKTTEKKTAKWRQAGSKSYTKTIMLQNRLYAISFIVAWLLPTIARIIQLFKPSHNIPNWYLVACGTVIPVQGFFNAIVYFRLRYQKYSRQNPDKRWYLVVTLIIIKTLVPCLIGHVYSDDGKDIEAAGSTRRNTSQA